MRSILASLMRGDLGTSRSLNQPVKELLRERLPITLVNLAFALAVGWLLGLALAIAAQIWDIPVLSFLANGLSGTFISTPAAALALVFLLLRWPPAFAAALLVFPKDLSLCAKSAATEQRDAARAYGARKRRRAMAGLGVARCPDCIPADHCAGGRFHQYWNWRAAAD